MNAVLDPIIAMMNIPAQPVDVGIPSQWQWRLQRLMHVLHLKLPTDYILFCQTFGSGNIQGDEHSLDIVSAFRATFCEFVLGECRVQFRYKDSCEITGMPFLMFPEQGGFLPFARTDSGGVIGWITSGTADDWKVVDMSVYDHDGFQETGLSFAGYLASLLTGDLRLTRLRNQPFLGEKKCATFTPAHPDDPIA